MKPIHQVNINRCVSVESNFCLHWVMVERPRKEWSENVINHNTKCNTLMGLIKYRGKYSNSKTMWSTYKLDGKKLINIIWEFLCDLDIFFMYASKTPQTLSLKVYTWCEIATFQTLRHHHSLCNFTTNMLKWPTIRIQLYISFFRVESFLKIINEIN